MSVYDKDSDTSVLLHFDDKNNLLKDECNNTWVKSNPSAKLDYNEDICVSKSSYVSNSDTYISTSNTLDFGGSDFTIDFWMYTGYTNKNDIYTIFQLYDSTASTTAKKNILSLSKLGTSTNLTLISGMTNLNQSKNLNKPDIIDNLIHIALVYIDSEKKLYWYENGTNIGSYTNQSFTTCSPTLIIGNNLVSETSLMDSIIIDEFRISKCARWTEAFDYTTIGVTRENIIDKQYEVDDNTKSLMHFEESITKDEISDLDWVNILSKPVLVDFTSKSKTKSIYNNKNGISSSTTIPVLYVQDVLSKCNLFDNSYQFTVDFWIMPIDESGGNIFYIGPYTYKYLTYPSIKIYMKNLKINIEMYDDKGTNILHDRTLAALPIFKWSHFAFVVKNNVTRIFVNGTLSKSNKISGNIRDIKNDDYMTLFGAGRVLQSSNKDSDNFLTRNFIGFMDEFRLSNCARWISNFDINKIYDVIDRTRTGTLWKTINL